MQYNKKETGKRFKQVREEWFRVWQADMASFFKVKQQTISNYENGVIDLPHDVINFLHAKGIRAEWLLFGEGPMADEGATPDDKSLTEIVEHHVRRNIEGLQFERDFNPANIMQNGVKLIIGDKRKVLANMDRKQVFFISTVSLKPTSDTDFDIVEMNLLPLDPSLVAPYPLNELVAIEISDESMEPLIKNHDRVVFRNRVVVNNDLHVCRWFSALMVKRIQFAAEGDIVILSENPKYEKQLIKKGKDFEILGKVICWVHRHD